MKTALTCLAALLLAGCTQTRYYAPVLLEKGSAPSLYTPVYANGISLPGGEKSYVNLTIKLIRPGFLHRDRKNDYWNRQELANAWKGKDVWVFIETEGLAGDDLFEANVDRKSVFSHVAVNSASFDALVVDMKPIPIELNKVHRVKAKIYSIEKYLLRKAVFTARDKSLGKWALDALGGFGKALTSAVAKEAVEYYRIATDQNFTLEQFLLTAGSTLEFSGSFDVIPDKTAQGEEAFKTFTSKQLALYDYIKSEQDVEWVQPKVPGAKLSYKPAGIAQYHETYNTIKQRDVTLAETLTNTSTQAQLQQSFIVFELTKTMAANVTF